MTKAHIPNNHELKRVMTMLQNDDGDMANNDNEDDAHKSKGDVGGTNGDEYHKDDDYDKQDCDVDDNGGDNTFKQL